MTSVVTVNEFTSLVTVQEVDGNVEIPVAAPQIIEVGVLGPQGPPGPAGGAASLRREEPLGTINGTNTVFSTSEPFVAGSTVLYLNGLALSVPDDYGESSPSEIQTVDPPLVGDRLLITYVEA